MATAFVPAPRFVGFAHSAPRELRDVDELYDLRAARPAPLVDVYRGTARSGGLPRVALPPGRTALLVRELTSRAGGAALG